MGQNNLNIEKIILEELDDIIEGDVDIKDIDINEDDGTVNVTFGLHTVDDDDYIGLCFY